MTPRQRRNIEPGKGDINTWMDCGNAVIDCVGIRCCMISNESSHLWISCEGTREQDRKARLKAVADKRKALKAAHPCTSYRAGGICILSAIGSRCPHARTKALANCEQAVAKKGVKA